LHPVICPVCASDLPGPVLKGVDRLLSTDGEFAVAECPACGLGVTLPRLAGEDLTRRYPDTYASHKPPAGLLARAIQSQRELRADLSLRTHPLKDALRDQGPGRLIDVGCGRGDLAAAFARHGWTAQGLDPSPKAVAAAREQGVDARAGVLADMPGDFTGYDLVIVNHALEHVPDPVGDLDRIRERLAPGGMVVISVPDWGTWQRRRFGSRWFHLDLPRHLQHFDEAALREACGRAGLRVDEVVPVISLVGLWASLQYAVFGRCIFRGSMHRVGLALAGALYPVTALAGRLFGADTMTVVARSAQPNAASGMNRSMPRPPTTG
jgi:SAM-dependent methyltransferase